MLFRFSIEHLPFWLVNSENSLGSVTPREPKSLPEQATHTLRQGRIKRLVNKVSTSFLPKIGQIDYTLTGVSEAMRIKDLRIQKGIKQGKQMAEMIGVSPQRYCDIETGRRRPTVEQAKLLGKMLDFDWWKLFE